MILRPSLKLNAKIRGGPLAVVPPPEDALLDWSAQLFIAARRQYVLLSHTASLYSAVLAGPVPADAGRFADAALHAIRDMLDGIGSGDLYPRRVEPAARPVRWAKARSRSVTGSMNELVLHATATLAEDGRAVRAVGDMLNGVLLSALGSGAATYRTPRDVFVELLGGPKDRTVPDGTVSRKRVTIISHIHGKITRDGKVSEPDIYWIIEKWLDRHPAIKLRTQDILVSRGLMTLAPGRKTDLISVSILAGPDIDGYDPARDEDLYAYFLAADPGDR